VTTDVAVAAPRSLVLRTSWVAASRRMIAIAFLRIAFGVILSVDRVIATRIPAWRRIAG